MVASKQKSVAVGNKVMDTRLPQPAGCGDKYDVYGWCKERMFSAFCMFFKYPSPDAKASPSPAGGEGLHRPWCHKILGTDCASRPWMTGGRGANSFGRSMIEMLGVLAIIAVLSVGGIAGYSKAMEKWKLDKAIEEYSMLIFGMQEYIESIQKYKFDGPHTGGVPIAEAANLIPASWNIQSTYGILDAYGNRLQIYIDNSPRYLVMDFYLQGMSKAETNQYRQTFSGKLCMEMFNNIIIPLNDTIYEAHIFRSQSGIGKNFSGKTSCAANKTCIRDMTLKDVHDACNYCTGKDSCAIVLSFS